jgi:hypothetical protein
MVRRHVAPRLHSNLAKAQGESDAATISDSSPVLGSDIDRELGALRPISVLADLEGACAASGTASRQPPRGPPLADV